MPAVAPDLLEGLAARGSSASASRAFVPVASGRIQPLQALYHRDLLGAVAARLERADPRERSLRGLLEDLGERCTHLEFDSEASFFNANTPADLRGLDLGSGL